MKQVKDIVWTVAAATLLAAAMTFALGFVIVLGVIYYTYKGGIKARNALMFRKARVT